MTNVTPGEFARYVLPLVLIGIYAGVENIGMRRWTASSFHRGICVFRQSLPVAHAPRTLPVPASRGSSFWNTRLEARRLSPTEVAFVYPARRAPIMRGLLRLDAGSRSVEVTGRLNVGLWALLGVGLLMTGVGALAVLPMLGLGVWTYWGERENFYRILSETAAGL